MDKTIRDTLVITLSTLLTTVLIWLPHILSIPNFWGLNFSDGFNTIYRNFDGLEYVVIAKTWYHPGLIAQIPQQMEAIYYSAHFPAFPILISLFAPLLGYLKSMLFVTLLFTVLSAIAFYFLVKNFRLTGYPLMLTLVFLVLPARWVIVRSVGSPEPVFIFFVITSIYFYLKYLHSLIFWHVLLSAILLSLAQLTRPPGALLALALGLFVFWQGYQKKSLAYVLRFWPFVLVPLTLLGIFWWYGQTYKDWFAYFHSGDNIHLFFPPFSIFNINEYWVGTIWLEDVIYIFLLGFLAGFLLIKQRLSPLAFLVFTYLTASIFVSHRDISRYTLPIAPFAIIAFEKVLTNKEFRWILITLGLAVYLYSQNFILSNVAPVPDLSVYN